MPNDHMGIDENFLPLIWVTLTSMLDDTEVLNLHEAVGCYFDLVPSAPVLDDGSGDMLEKLDYRYNVTKDGMYQYGFVANSEIDEAQGHRAVSSLVEAYGHTYVKLEYVKWTTP